MGKKTEGLNRLVKKLAARYGHDDVDVVRLKADLEELQTLRTLPSEKHASVKTKFDFRSNARRLYESSGGGERH